MTNAELEFKKMARKVCDALYRDNKCEDCDLEEGGSCLPARIEKKRGRRMSAKDFENALESGWDFAIEQLEQRTADTDLILLCKIYHYGYGTMGYINTSDCDDGLCFSIRQFAVEQICKLLEDTE